MSNGPYLTHLGRKQISDFLFSSVHRDVNFTVTVLLFSWRKRIPWLRPCTPPIAISQSEPAEKNIDRRSLNVRPPERGYCDTDPTETPTIISFLTVYMTNFITLNMCFKKIQCQFVTKQKMSHNYVKITDPTFLLVCFMELLPGPTSQQFPSCPGIKSGWLNNSNHFGMDKPHAKDTQENVWTATKANYLLINGLT